MFDTKNHSEYPIIPTAKYILNFLFPPGQAFIRQLVYIILVGVLSAFIAAAVLKAFQKLYKIFNKKFLARILYPRAYAFNESIEKAARLLNFIEEVEHSNFIDYEQLIRYSSLIHIINLMFSTIDPEDFEEDEFNWISEEDSGYFSAYSNTEHNSSESADDETD